MSIEAVSDILLGGVSAFSGGGGGGDGAPLDSPQFTGTPTAPTAAPGTNSTQIATTAFIVASFATIASLSNYATTASLSNYATVASLSAYATTSSLSSYAPLASPALTGNPTAPTQTAGNNTTRIATTAFVTTAIASKANLASPTFTGTPAAPTATAGTNTTQIATTAFVATAIGSKANLASPAFTGTPTAPTASTGTNTTQIATTAFVQATQRFSVSKPGKPSANEVLARVGVKAGTFTTSASVSKSRVGAASSYAVIVKKNDTQVATITFASGATLGVLSANITTVDNDVLSFHGAATADANLEDIAIGMST